MRQHATVSDKRSSSSEAPTAAVRPNATRAVTEAAVMQGSHGTSGPQGFASPESALGAGQRLDSATRSFMESRLGYSFGDVRIHAARTGIDYSYQCRIELTNTGVVRID